MTIRRLAVIGVGLIGGSLALALRRAGACAEVVGCGRNEAALRRGVELGVIDRWSTDPAQAVEGADVVVLGVPLGAVRAVLQAIRGHLAEDAVVTDVGSAKLSVVTAAQAVFGQLPPWLVPGHPIAGNERSGVEAATADLFQRRRVILTPTSATDPGALERVGHLWRAAGADVLCTDPEHHDQVLAATSHLPHMLAFGLVDTLARWEGVEEIFAYAAGGFRDFTRIASSDPVMWRDICLANREALLAALHRYRADLEQLTALIEAGDAEGLQAVFENAKATRDRYLPLFEG